MEGEDSLSFTKIIDIGNGMCASVGYTELKSEFSGSPIISKNQVSASQYKSWDSFKSYRDKGMSHSDYIEYVKRVYYSTAYLIIWDHNGQTYQQHYMNSRISDESILKLNNDGNLLMTLAINPITTFFVDAMNHMTTENSLYLIDLSETIASNKLVPLWYILIDNREEGDDFISFTLSDLLVESNGDIVFTGIQKDVSQHYHDNFKLNMYSSYLCLGRVSSTGNLLSLKFADGFNLSAWGGSDKGSLESDHMPGKIYFGDIGLPRLTNSPVGDGYILVHRGAYDRIP